MPEKRCRGPRKLPCQLKLNWKNTAAELVVAECVCVAVVALGTAPDNTASSAMAPAIVRHLGHASVGHDLCTQEQ